MEKPYGTKYKAGLRWKIPRKQKRVQNDGEEEYEEKAGKRGKNEKMTVSWWNGGGKLIPRMKVNPVLKKYLETKPDIFVYGEALHVLLR